MCGIARQLSINGIQPGPSVSSRGHRMAIAYSAEGRYSFSTTALLNLHSSPCAIEKE
jgi:hypothetical protein